MRLTKKRLQGDTQREANTTEVSGLKSENLHLKELVAELALKNRVLKKSSNGWDAELEDVCDTAHLKKLEVIRIVEQSELPVKHTLQELDIAPSTFYDWYHHYLTEGADGLICKRKGLRRFWNKILRSRT